METFWVSSPGRAELIVREQVHPQLWRPVDFKETKPGDVEYARHRLLPPSAARLFDVVFAAMSVTKETIHGLISLRR